MVEPQISLQALSKSRRPLRLAVRRRQQLRQQLQQQLLRQQKLNLLVPSQCKKQSLTDQLRYQHRLALLNLKIISKNLKILNYRIKLTILMLF